MHQLLTRTQLLWIFLSLFGLRMAIGFHFFMEGTGKLKQGDWSAAPFLNAAKGPVAPLFHDMLDDPDGDFLLFVNQGGLVVPDSNNGVNRPLTNPPVGNAEIADSRSSSLQSPEKIKLSTRLTFLLWDDFADHAKSYYELGSAKLIEDIQRRREKDLEEIKRAQQEQDSSVSIANLETRIQEDQQSIRSIPSQVTRLETIIENHKSELNEWIEANRVELLEILSTRDRLEGFERDGISRNKVIDEVDSLRKQVDLIKSDRTGKLQAWRTQVTAIWDSLESQVQGLTVDRQAFKTMLKVHRPFDQPQSKLKWINAFIPWFDTIVGGLLMLGLFSRFAAGAGGLFLLSVVASQPPWISGAKPVYFETVEMLAMFVLSAVASGRFAGLDYFVFKPRGEREPD